MRKRPGEKGQTLEHKERLGWYKNKKIIIYLSGSGLPHSGGSFLVEQFACKFMSVFKQMIPCVNSPHFLYPFFS